jgi:hypothetical protein
MIVVQIALSDLALMERLPHSMAVQCHEQPVDMMMERIRRLLRCCAYILA